MRTKLILSAILLSTAIGVPAAVLAGDDDSPVKPAQRAPG